MDRTHSDSERAEHYRRRAIELVNLIADSTGDERLCRRLIELTRQYLTIADGIDTNGRKRSIAKAPLEAA